MVRRALKGPQTARLSALHQDIAGHPSRGLTPPKLARILAGAEQGDISAQCDLFDDMEEKDGHIFAEMAKRKRALLGLPFEIQPPVNATRQEQRQAEEARELFRPIPDLEDIIFDLADAIGHGFACLDISWRQAGRHWQVASCEHRPQRWFQVVGQEDIRLANGRPEGERLWPFGWVAHKHRARSGHLARAGLHRSLAWPYLFKNFSARDLIEFLEIYGLPLRLGSYPAGAGEDEKQTLLEAVTHIGHAAAGIIPEGMMIDFKAPAKGSKDPFEYLIDWCERTPSKVILGATLTSQTDAGSGAYALGNVHLEVMRDLVISDARQIANTISRDLLYPLAALNIPGVTPARAPRFVFDTHECEDIQIYAEALPKLVDIGLAVPAAWAHERLGIPEAGAGEAVLARNHPALTGTPPGEGNDSGRAASGTKAEGNNPALFPSPGGVAGERLTGWSSTSPGVSLKAGAEDQDVVDQYVAQLDAASMAAMADLIAPVRALVFGAESLEALQDGIIELYAERDPAELGQVLEQALLVAELAGRFEAGND